MLKCFQLTSGFTVKRYHNLSLPSNRVSSQFFTTFVSLSKITIQHFGVHFKFCEFQGLIECLNRETWDFAKTIFDFVVSKFYSFLSVLQGLLPDFNNELAALRLLLISNSVSFEPRRLAVNRESGERVRSPLSTGCKAEIHRRREARPKKERKLNTSCG